MSTHIFGYVPTPQPTSSSGVLSTTAVPNTTPLANNTAPDGLIWFVEAGDTITLIEVLGRKDTAVGSATAHVGAYITDVTAATEGATTIPDVPIVVDSNTVAWYASTPLSIDLTPWAGQWIKLSYNHDESFRRGQVVGSAGNTVFSGSNYPNPFGSGSLQATNYCLRATVNRVEAFSITSVNDDDEINPGEVNTAEVVGYVAGVNPVVSGTVGSLALTGVSQAGTTVTFTPPAPTNAAYWPEPDATQTLTLTDGTNPATFDALFNSISGYTSVVIASPDNDDEYKLGYWATFPFEDGDRVMFDPPNPAPPDSTTGWTVNADGSYQDAPDGVKIWHHWRTATSLIYIYEATVGGGAIISNTGLSVAGLSVTGLSVAGLSVTGL